MTTAHSSRLQFLSNQRPGQKQLLPVGDCNFNGLEDTLEEELEELLFRIFVFEDVEYEILTCVSLKDETAGLVNRYPRAIWDQYFEWNFLLQDFVGTFEDPPLPPEAVFGHRIVGSYCLKITLAEHVDPSERPPFAAAPVINGLRNDMNGRVPSS